MSRQKPFLSLPVMGAIDIVVERMRYESEEGNVVATKQGHNKWQRPGGARQGPAGRLFDC